jgi:hypothetical protein
LISMYEPTVVDGRGSGLRRRKGGEVHAIRSTCAIVVVDASWKVNTASPDIIVRPNPCSHQVYSLTSIFSFVENVVISHPTLILRVHFTLLEQTLAP